MKEEIRMSGPPDRLLLATDLSARCDRALDRAAQLAREWHAELVVLNAIEGPQAPDLALAWAFQDDEESSVRIAREQLRQDLEQLDVPARIRIVRGEADEAIRTVADETGCGLIVTGMARNETFGRFLPGNSVERLARSASQPLLVVRNRPRNAYQRIVVATDFSESSRHALHTASRFFPGRELILYHTCAASTAVDAVSREAAKRQCDDFLEASDLTEGTRRALHTVIENGKLEVALTRYIREQDVDLVLIGTRGRNALMEILLGSTAARLLDWLPCDTMIVHAAAAD